MQKVATTKALIIRKTIDYQTTQQRNNFMTHFQVLLPVHFGLVILVPVGGILLRTPILLQLI